MVYIYVLQLQGGKYYVGKTDSPEFRIDDHFNSNGSAWTRRYKPVKVIKIIPNCDDYDEDKYTRMYMDKYGIENVRGGTFVSLELDHSTITHLEQMSNGANNKCFACGKRGHFANECEENDGWETESDDSVWVCDYCDKEFTDVKKCEYHEQRCSRKPNGCFRCGREGHYASSCYASSHIRGYNLKTSS